MNRKFLTNKYYPWYLIYATKRRITLSMLYSSSGGGSWLSLRFWLTRCSCSGNLMLFSSHSPERHRERLQVYWNKKCYGITLHTTPFPFRSASWQPKGIITFGVNEFAWIQQTNSRILIRIVGRATCFVSGLQNDLGRPTHGEITVPNGPKLGPGQFTDPRMVGVMQ